jgi:hypothetical protein
MNVLISEEIIKRRKHESEQDKGRGNEIAEVVNFTI